jgi:hypothetical protein
LPWICPEVEVIEESGAASTLSLKSSSAALPPSAVTNCDSSVNSVAACTGEIAKAMTEAAAAAVILER